MPLDLAALKGQAGDYLKSDQFKSLMPYLISGGAGALLGGLSAGRRRKGKGEGRLGYLGRVLRNALVAGGLAGGAHYLLGRGGKQVAGELSANPDLPQASPAENVLRTIGNSPITAGATGLGALTMTKNMPVIGAQTDSQVAAKNTLLGKINEKLNTEHEDAKKSVKAQRDAEKARGLPKEQLTPKLPKKIPQKDLNWLRNAPADEMAKITGGDYEMERNRRLAGKGSSAPPTDLARLKSDPTYAAEQARKAQQDPGFLRKLKGIGSTARRSSGTLLGQGGIRQTLRGGGAAGVALLPAMLTAALTPDRSAA